MHPILFHWHFLTIRSYGVCMALAFAAGIALAAWLNRKDGRQDDAVLDLAVWLMVGSVIGARVLYVIVQPQEFAARPWEVFFIWQGGLVYYGGLVGGALAGAWWIRGQKLPLWPMADCLAPAIALGQAIGRQGCFLNGCCYGVVNFKYGVIFPAIGDNLPHLPTEQYESFACLALAAFLVWFKLRRRSFEGQVFWIYVLSYSVIRFVIEFWRGDVARGTLISPLLSPSQWISLVTFSLGLWFLWKLGKKAS